MPDLGSSAPVPSRSLGLLRSGGAVMEVLLLERHTPLCPGHELTTGAMSAKAIGMVKACAGTRQPPPLPGRTGGSFEHAHVVSHMSEMGGQE
jgi:hypothetical protein